MPESHNKNEIIVIRADIDLEDLIPGFLENQKRDAARIRDFIGSDDYESIQRIGHSMKGSGGGYGFDEITDIGMRIEQAAKVKDSVGILRHVEDLLHYLSCIEVVYD